MSRKRRRTKSVLAEPRRMLVKESSGFDRLAVRVSIEDDVSTAFDSSMRSTLELLFDGLATLAILADANKGKNPEPKLSGTRGTVIPSFVPAWAAEEMRRADNQLRDLADHLQAWTSNPRDPAKLHAVCTHCGTAWRRGDIHCRVCGTPVLAAFRVCGCGGGGRHLARDHA